MAELEQNNVNNASLREADFLESDTSREVLRYVLQQLVDENRTTLLSFIADTHDSDIAHLLSLMSFEQRSQFMQLVGHDLPAHVYPELDPAICHEIVEYLDLAHLVTTVQTLESDDAVFLLEDLDEEDREEILEQIPETDRLILQRALDFPEDSAGRLMRSAYVSVPPFWTVGQTIDYLRIREDLPYEFLEIFVLDSAYKPLGVVPLNRILRAKRPELMQQLIDEDFSMIDAYTDREQVALMFERYNWVSAAIVDKDQRMLGVITADDVLEVITEEAGEDILRLGGVGDEAMTDNVIATARGRFSWLFINLLTAILASLVIGLFDASLKEMVALAILMPIVASMGGNAGTQTLTVTVRGLATRELLPANIRRVILRELGVGVINGLLFAVGATIIGILWFGDWHLGLVLALAMIVTLLVAALAGILIPLTLEKVKIDPAIASTVFVTTLTDVIGFLAFLGFATLFLFT